MDLTDKEFSSRFVASVVKSMQTVCHGYLDFDHSIRIQGHIVVTVDHQSGKNYILNELILKDNDESSTIFHSGSFHAEPPLRSRKANMNIEMMNSTVLGYRNSGYHHVAHNDDPQMSDCSVLDDPPFDLPTMVPPIRTKLEKYAHRSKRSHGSSHTLSYSESHSGLHTSPGMKMTLRKEGDEGWVTDTSLKNHARSGQRGGLDGDDCLGEKHTPVSSRYFQAGAMGTERLEEPNEEVAEHPVHTLLEAGAGGSAVPMHSARQVDGTVMIDNVVSLAGPSPPPERWPEIKTEADDSTLLSSSMASHSFTLGTAVVDPHSQTSSGRGSMAVMQLDAGGTAVHHMERDAAHLVQEGELDGLSPDTEELPVQAFPPSHPGSQALVQDAVAALDPGLDFNPALASSSSACPKLHKVVNRLHTTRKAIGKHAGHSQEADSQSKRPKQSAATRSNRHKQSHPKSVRSGLPRKKGNKQSTWRLSMLLLASKDASCVPTIEEIVELERHGLGRPAKEMTDGSMRCLRKQTRQQINDFVVKSYPNTPLGAIGFSLATATKGRKFMLIPEHADSGFIEQTLGHGKLYIIPHRDIPLSYQITNGSALTTVYSFAYT